MEQFFSVYFLETGLGWAVLGAIGAVMFGGIGSARGVSIAASQAAGIISEKPELFGKLFILMGLPATQAFYGFIYAFMVMAQAGLLGGGKLPTPLSGVMAAFIGLGTGVVLWRSAVYQGEAAAAAINMTAKKPEEAGRAIIIPALVETFAIVALLAAILLLFLLPDAVARIGAVPDTTTLPAGP